MTHKLFEIYASPTVAQNGIGKAVKIEFVQPSKMLQIVMSTTGSSAFVLFLKSRGLEIPAPGKAFHSPLSAILSTAPATFLVIDNHTLPSEKNELQNRNVVGTLVVDMSYAMDVVRLEGQGVNKLLSKLLPLDIQYLRRGGQFAAQTVCEGIPALVWSTAECDGVCIAVPISYSQALRHQIKIHLNSANTIQ